MILKEKIEKRLEFREENRIDVGLPGFAPLTPRASHPNTQEHPHEYLTEKFFNYSLFILLQSELPHHNQCETKF